MSHTNKSVGSVNSEKNTFLSEKALLNLFYTNTVHIILYPCVRKVGMFTHSAWSIRYMAVESSFQHWTVTWLFQTWRVDTLSTTSCTQLLQCIYLAPTVTKMRIFWDSVLIWILYIAFILSDKIILVCFIHRSCLLQIKK